ncbi:hypothetical protein EYS14_09210 [Alteromonadaceae bacterium M269]|nr:hypothetical protein EYS14_09210 [Alteromonadaceae bacterium M269]
MRTVITKIIFSIGLITLSIASTAQTNEPLSNTKVFDEGKGSPKAKVENVGWISGHWEGEIWDGRFEEIWSPPLAGSMMASFKYMEEDQVGFYELITIVEEEESLTLRLKHFSSDLSGWEKEDETIDFRLVELKPDTAYFDGYTFKRISNNEMHVFILLENEGETQETQFVFKRRIN